MRILLAAALAVSFALSFGGAATAATMDMCADGTGSPADPADGGDRFMTLEAVNGSGLVECVAWGTGNFNAPPPDDFNDLATYLDDEFDVELLSLLSKVTGDGTEGSDPGALGGFVDDADSGTITIDADPEYPFYVVIFKFGGGSGDPDWFAYLVDNDAFDGGLDWSWGDEGRTNGLSGISVYAAVPIPAAGFLLLGGLGGLAMLKRRKKV